MKQAFQSTVLGKRKATRQIDTLVLHLSPTPTSETPLPDQSDCESSGQQASTSKGLPIIINGQLVEDTKRRYRCMFKGCEKAYTKPSRLEEHERSHTGQRPFVCETCGNSYLRETHLHAHARSHLPETSRPFVCERDNCGKRFWTSQHLQVHHSWHDGAKPYKCNEVNCHEAFAKHHLLRAHVCSEHAPPGTKPYRCEHEGCTKSFDTNQHLKTHQKTHDGKRYTCVHVSCLAGVDDAPTFFPTWSALQSHMRMRHPPTCSHPSCNGRTFANQTNLRAHLKLHEEREADIEMDNGVESDDNSDQAVRKKRRGGEYFRDWQCEVGDCGKDFKSKKALNTHTNVTHLGKRDFTCDYADCNHSFGYKHLLQRHQAKVHQSVHPVTDFSGEDPSETEAQGGHEATFDIDMITGNAYAKRAEANVKNAKALCCPFPSLQDLTGDPCSVNPASHSIAACDYVFSRGYDLRRHLSASHDIMVSKETIDSWVRRQKQGNLCKIFVGD
ncbi:hypothetical protein BDZ97DRAFT_1649233 [Flammula alnicola]|nr:hypothetical protein BDZ97DRAFT_1649233 [Flammula alnicola]